MRVKILGRYWELVEDPTLRRWGECDHPETPNKQIRIKPGLSEEEELDTLLHEIQHAGDKSKAWASNEEWVTQLASDAARILIRCGWRKVEPGSGA